MRDIEEIILKTSEVFMKLGFVPTIIGEKQTYGYNGSYHKIDFIKNLDERDFLVIESAANFEEAKNNLYEDSDLLPLDLETEKLISNLEKLLKTYYMEG